MSAWTYWTCYRSSEVTWVGIVNTASWYPSSASAGDPSVDPHGTAPFVPTINRWLTDAGFDTGRLHPFYLCTDYTSSDVTVLLASWPLITHTKHVRFSSSTKGDRLCALACAI